MADSILLRVPIDDKGEYVLVEVDRRDVSEEVSLAASGTDYIVDATTSLAGSMRRLRPVIRTMLTQLGSVGPDQLALQFGVKIGGETGLIIAKGTAEASFTVTIAWQRPQSGVDVATQQDAIFGGDGADS